MIICFSNQKGGVGKTTLTLSTAYEFRKLGYNVLVIDADPQASIMDWSDIREEPLPKGISIAAMAKKTIHRDLETLSKGYNCVIIDTPPRVTDITRSAIMASNIVVVPCTPSPYDVWATEETIDLIREAKIYHKSLISSFMLNRKLANTVISREVKEAIKSLGNDVSLLESEITQRVIFAEAANSGKVVQEIDCEGKATLELSKFVLELNSFCGEKNEKIED